MSGLFAESSSSRESSNSGTPNLQANGAWRATGWGCYYIPSWRYFVNRQSITVFTASECLVQTCVYIYNMYKLIKNDAGSSHFQVNMFQRMRPLILLQQTGKCLRWNLRAPGRRGNCDGEAKQIVGNKLWELQLWFQTFFNVHPENWEKWSNLTTQYFSDGLVWFNHQPVVFFGLPVWYLKDPDKTFT